MDLVIVVFFIILIFYLVVKYFSDGNENSKKNLIKKLLKQSTKFIVSSEQDNASIISLLHANYGVAYFYALKNIASDEEIEQLGNIDIQEFEKQITSVQDIATKNVVKKCPECLPNFSNFNFS